ncbi:MAG: AraC family transcriptional regulator [Spirochaetes bacterium]|nr:AraC family transcriptional regulator [Spirochaetota bacterium]
MTLSELTRLVPDSIVIMADHFRFASNERRSSSCVGSRRLLWCRSGKGLIVANGERFPFAAGNFIFMPWHHAVEYQADRRSPFAVGSIHIIAHHPHMPVRYAVPHDERTCRTFTERRDVSITGLDGVVSGDFAQAPALGMLAEYTVTAFRRGPDEALLRALAPVVIHEVCVSMSTGMKAMPPALAVAVTYLEKQKTKVSLAELARVSRCSASTVIRMFREHFNTTPGHYVIERRIAQAKELLINTGMPVESVGETVGIPDPFYFSRIFKKVTGRSPRQCRAESRFI